MREHKCLKCGKWITSPTDICGDCATPEPPVVPQEGIREALDDAGKRAWQAAISIIKGKKWKVLGEPSMTAEDFMQPAAYKEILDALAERDAALSNAAAAPTTTRNSEVLKSFTEYSEAHPRERFWQALRNWAEAAFVMVDGDDSFYWEGRISPNARTEFPLPAPAPQPVQQESALEVLREIQWSSTDGIESRCPKCWRSERQALHTAECIVGRALSQAK